MQLFARFWLIDVKGRHRRDGSFLCDILPILSYQSDSLTASHRDTHSDLIDIDFDKQDGL